MAELALVHCARLPLTALILTYSSDRNEDGGNRKKGHMESKINLSHVVPVNYKLTATLVNQVGYLHTSFL